MQFGRKQYGHWQYGQKQAGIEISLLRPDDGSEDVAKTTPLLISFTDIAHTDALIYVRGELIYNGPADAFAAGWQGSSYAANDDSGYDFAIVPDTFNRWRAGEVVTIMASVGSVEEAWSFTAADSVLGTDPIYGMVIRSLRKMDEQD